MFYLFYFVVVGQVQTFWNQKNKKLKNNKNAKKKKQQQTNKQTNQQTKLKSQITFRGNLSSLSKERVSIN